MQNICPENQWDDFLTSLKTDLPMSFRITSSCDLEAKQLLKLIEGGLFTDLLQRDISESSKPFCLPW